MHQMENQNKRKTAQNIRDVNEKGHGSERETDKSPWKEKEDYIVFLPGERKKKKHEQKRVTEVCKVPHNRFACKRLEEKLGKEIRGVGTLLQYRATG